MFDIRPAIDNDMFTIMDIRNSGREFMTHHTGFITKNEQIAWWWSPMRQQSTIWIAEVNDIPVGFCMIREMYDSGRNYGTLALLPEYRGQGYGTALYQFMMSQVSELWIDVRNDNIASMNAALKAGFEVYSISSTITTLLYR